MSLHCFFFNPWKNIWCSHDHNEHFTRRLPLHSPRYCGQFSQSGLFCCCFQNWNTRYLLTLIPKTNRFIFVFVTSPLRKKKTASFAASALSWKLCVCEKKSAAPHQYMHNVSALYIYLWMSLFTLTSSGTLNFLRSAINFCLKFFWC